MMCPNTNITMKCFEILVWPADPGDDGHLAAEQEARKEAEIERRDNLQEESASALADLSLSSKTSQEVGT